MDLFYVISIQKINKLSRRSGPLRELTNKLLKEFKEIDKETDLKELLRNDPNRFFEPLSIACLSRKPPLMVLGIDTMQKMITYGHINSDVPLASDPNVALIDIVIQRICGCFDVPNYGDDEVLLQIIKALLQAVTMCHVHGRSLRNIVKTCVNVFLVSPNASIRSAAKATLTQILNVIFQKMEKFEDQAEETKFIVDEGDLDADNISASPQKRKSPKKKNTSNESSESTQEFIRKFTEKIIEDVVKQNSSTGNEKGKNPTFRNQFEKDAFFLFRALCKLSMKKLPTEPEGSIQLRCRILSLELINFVLETSGPIFQENETFVMDIRKVLCMSLLKNAVSTIPEIFSLALQIFKTLVMSIKHHLKSEIGLFFTDAFLRVLQSSNSTYKHKTLVLEVLDAICEDPQTIVDIFVNYDCSLQSLNIFESLVADLRSVAIQQHAEAGWVTLQQEKKLQEQALMLLVKIMKLLKEWMNKDDQVQLSDSASCSQSNPEDIDFEKLKKEKMTQVLGVKAFNKSAKKGISYLIDEGIIENNPEEIAKYMYGNDLLDKAKIGEVLGMEGNLNVLQAFTGLQSFKNKDFLSALRSFLTTFKLPGEGQIIDRIVQSFSSKYVAENTDGVFQSTEQAYVFSYSVIMLNTDLHNPALSFRDPMTLEEFIEQNHEDPDPEIHLPAPYLKTVYEDILRNEIKLKDNHTSPSKKNLRGDEKFNNNLSLQKKKQMAYEGEGMKIVKKAHHAFQTSWGGKGDFHHETAFYTASDPKYAKSMFEVCWEEMLTAMMHMFEQTKDSRIAKIALTGIRHGIEIASKFGLYDPLLKFVSKIHEATKLTMISTLQNKNITCIQVLLELSISHRNSLGPAWKPILECFSQLEYIQGMQNTYQKESIQARHRGHVQQAALFESELRNSNLVFKSIDPTPLDKIFMESENLNDENILHFVKHLCDISEDELKSKRTFSLQKLIIVAHFNITRSKFVWAKIWQPMANHFIDVACLPDVDLCMRSIDALRQLAMKFLEQGELENFSFQANFLRPFLDILKRSDNGKMKTLIVECVGQIIQLQDKNIKSGWKTILQILSQAAKDTNPTVVQQGHSYCNLIVKEKFEIVKSNAFVDLIYCLVAFGNSKTNSEIALENISNITLCTDYITNKEFDSFELVDGKFTNDPRHNAVWLPILSGLSSMVSSVEVIVRTHALTTLMNILNQHGGKFTPELWELIYRGVLVTIFVDVHQAEDVASFTEWITTTCNRAMSELVDLFSTFFDIVHPFAFSIMLNLISSCIHEGSDRLSNIGHESALQVVMKNHMKFTLSHWTQILQTYEKMFSRTSVLYLNQNPESVSQSAVRIRSATQLGLKNSLDQILKASYDSFSLEQMTFILDQILMKYYTQIYEVNTQSGFYRPEAKPSQDLLLSLETELLSLYVQFISVLQDDKRTEFSDLGSSRIKKIARRLIVKYVNEEKEVSPHTQISVHAISNLINLLIEKGEQYDRVLYHQYCTLIQSPSLELRRLVMTLLQKIGQKIFQKELMDKSSLLFGYQIPIQFNQKFLVHIGEANDVVELSQKFSEIRSVWKNQLKEKQVSVEIPQSKEQIWNTLSNSESVSQDFDHLLFITRKQDAGPDDKIICAELKGNQLEESHIHDIKSFFESSFNRYDTIGLNEMILCDDNAISSVMEEMKKYSYVHSHKVISSTDGSININMKEEFDEDKNEKIIEEAAQVLQCTNDEISLPQVPSRDQPLPDDPLYHVAIINECFLKEGEEKILFSKLGSLAKQIHPKFSIKKIGFPKLKAFIQDYSQFFAIETNDNGQSFVTRVTE